MSHERLPPPTDPRALQAPGSQVHDWQVVALTAIIVRHLGGDYVPPRYPALCADWVASFRTTFANPETRPIETVFNANPIGGSGALLDVVKEGDVSWPLFAMWREKNTRKRHTAGIDRVRVFIKWLWMMPANSETERIWPLLNEFDENMRRVIAEVNRTPEDRNLLRAARIGDFGRADQTYSSEQGYKGPGNHTIFPTLSGQFEYDCYWANTEASWGLQLQAFNQAYMTYLVRGRKESGSMWDTRLTPPLESSATTTHPSMRENP